MPCPDRTEGGHRAYGSSHVRRLAFIRRARELEFGIENIRALLTAVEPGHRSCAEVREIASAHLAEVQTKLADLARLERILADTIGRCSGDQSPACPVFDMLDARP
jgi:MerR family mercuric resistance operon transcriptional regulator